MKDKTLRDRESKENQLPSQDSYSNNNQLNNPANLKEEVRTKRDGTKDRDNKTWREEISLKEETMTTPLDTMTERTSMKKEIVLKEIGMIGTNKPEGTKEEMIKTKSMAKENTKEMTLTGMTEMIKVIEITTTVRDMTETTEGKKTTKEGTSSRRENSTMKDKTQTPNLGIKESNVNKVATNKELQDSTTMKIDLRDSMNRSLREDLLITFIKALISRINPSKEEVDLTKRQREITIEDLFPVRMS